MYNNAPINDATAHSHGQKCEHTERAKEKEKTTAGTIARTYIESHHASEYIRSWKIQRPKMADEMENADGTAGWNQYKYEKELDKEE